MRLSTPLFAALLLVGSILLVSPTPAEAQIDCFSCSCTDSCSTTCTYMGLDPNCVPTPDTPCGPVTRYGTCGANGIYCATDPDCEQPQHCNDNPTCTSYVNLTSGNDTYAGTSAKECVWGNNGNDTLDGNAGDDWLYGGSGTDTLFGDSGNDCMLGQGNSDHIDGESGSADTGDGGAGADNCTAATETQISC